MANPILSEQFVRLLDKRLKKVSEDEYKSLPTMIEVLYNRQGSDSAFEEYFEVGALPDIPEFTGKLQSLSIAPGFHTKIEPKEFAGQVIIDRKLLDDKKYNVMDNMAKKLSESAQRTQEKIGVRPFAYAFSAAFDYMTKEEGVALCGSHTTKAGVSTSSGFSNSGTSAFNKTSLAATRLLMRKFKNDIGERIDVNPDTVICPDNLYDSVMEVVGSELDPTSANNAKNMQYERFKVIPYLRLDDYDTNNWFLVDSRKMKDNLLWLDRIKPEVNNTVDFDTFQIKHSIYFRVANGFLNWRWIYGMNVS